MQKHTSSRFKSETNGERIWWIEVAFMVLRLAKKESWEIFRFSPAFGSIIGIQIQGKNLPRNKDGTLLSVKARGFDE